ncbi:hypothetical protein L218DRAFT_1036180 [Marasmius fiardii PR-910]|nr:hypothetical protein L218DRAFT_1036180 [Marasmius fiardii PR-910]
MDLNGIRVWLYIALKFGRLQVLMYFTTVTPLFPRLYRDEIIFLVVLWLLWLGGAAATSAGFMGIDRCQALEACRLLSALLAFSWLGWITLTVLLIVSPLASRRTGGLGTAIPNRYSDRTGKVDSY